MVDVAPTIAALLGVAPPDHIQRRVLIEAMGPQTERTRRVAVGE